MKKLQLALLSLFITVSAMAQLPTLIEVSEENWEAYYQSDFKNVLGYVAQGVDTVLLVTSGFEYTTVDTNPLVINAPVVIMAAPGLAEKPILTHSNPDTSSSMEIFRITQDVVFDGIAFEGALDQPRGLKYALRYGDWTDDDGNVLSKAKTGANITVKNCDFNSFHSEGDQDKQGNVLYFLRPGDTTLDHIKAGNVKFENCTFKDIGDEAIRISEGEKYPVGSVGTVCYDTLIVRNCTFDDIDAECIRIYGDTDTSFAGPTYVDGLTLVEKITVVNSAPRFIYAKNFRKTIVRDVLVANSRETSVNRQDRGDYTMQIQLSGSEISHVDTFNVGQAYTLFYEPSIGATKGGYVDEATIYGYDPQFTDAAAGNYEVNEPALYVRGSDGGFIGDPRWATNPPAEGVERVATPDRFTLQQNFPNPFNPSTEINFTIERADFTTLRIFNVVGQLIDTPQNGFLWDGSYNITFDASHLPSGVYFYELRQGEYSDVKKMMLLK